METVEKKIKSIADEMGVKYLFMNWAQANVELDNINEPTIVYVLPASGSIMVNSFRGRAYDFPKASIFFISPTDFDFEGRTNDGVIEQMKRLAIEFIYNVNESGHFQHIDGEIEYQVVYDMLDDNLTGIGLNLQLYETEGVSMCEDEEYKRDGE